uniref:cysteine dioxygenase n=1 Tax=Oryza sativa subsp. japonica TaxID=39947 RepID=Q5VRG6_ORYSJ|nr:HGWP repeat containing protein-like [Oryza sativa Japonica Group]BAD67959.1 HGWP repeat containing protein-like [Oryza sativa Japonica Group]
MDSRRLSFPVDRPQVHSAGLSSPPPLLITTTTSPPACLRRRRVVPPPTRLAYYAAAVGRLRLHHRPASVAADWCFRLHGWPIMPPLLGVHVFTDRLAFTAADWCFRLHGWPLCRRCWASTSSPTGLPSPLPTGVSACTAGLYAAVIGRLRLHRPAASSAADWCFRLHGWPLCRRCWASTSSPTGLPPSPPTGASACTAGHYAAAVGRLRLHRRPASVAADWCLRLHGWPIMPPLLGVYDFTIGLPSPLPTGVSACTAGLYAAVVGRLRLHRLACLRRCRLVFPPTRLAYYAAAVGRLRLHHRPASVAADWCLRLHGWPIMPPLLGVYDFTTGLPPSPPIGASAYTAGLLCRRCWASTTSPPACLRRRRLVPPPTRLAYYATAVGRLRLHRRPASVAADWCLRLHGWPIMPPLLGVYDFTIGLPSPLPTGVSACTAGLYAAVVGRLRLHRLACLRRCRLVFPPTRLAYYAAAVGRLRLHHRPASVAADWCLRLHGWPIMPPLLGVYDFTTGLPPSPPIGASAYTAGLLCRRCWASTTSPPACLRRRRLVPPPTRLAYYAAAVGRLRLHRRPASVAADWCLRLHGWPIMPPLLGVYDFTISLPSPLPTGVSACTAGLYAAVVGRLRLHRRACLRRRRLVPPPTRLAYYAAAVGRLRLHHRPASVAADWCLRLHGWPIMPPLLGVYDFAAGLPPSPPIGASAYTAGLLCRRCWASTTSPPACLRRRRLVPPPTRLAYCAAAVGRLRLHRRPASVAADWCLRLHGWPIMPPLLGVYDFTIGLPPSPPIGASAYTAGLLCRRCWASTTSPPACLRRRRVVPPPTRLAYYAAAVGRLRLHHRPASVAADWCLRLHGWPIMPPLLGVYDFTAGLPPSPPSGASAYTAGLLCRRCWASTTSPPACLRRRRLVSPPIRSVGHTTVDGHRHLHRRPASVAADWIQIQICIKGIHGFKLISYAPGMDQSEHHHRLASTAADWCSRLHGWPIMPPLLGVYVFTDRLAFAAADWCFRLHGWPIMPPLLGVYVFTDRLAFAAADWCFRLHGWPIMPPLLGVYVFTDRLAFAAADWRLRLHRPACLCRCRLVFPPARLAFMPPLLGVYVFTDRLAFAAADWCFRLHGWPLCRRCWASTSSPTGRLVRRRLLGVYVFTDRLAFVAADWCPRLHGWPVMPPLLGAYVFTDRLAFVVADRCPRLHGWPLCRRCWASTSSPTGLPSPPPTGVSACTAGLYAAVVGRLRLHRPVTASAADWCHRLHGWPVITPTDAIFFTAGYIAVTTNRHQYLQHKLPTFAMAADWFLHFHGYMILPVLISLIFFTAANESTPGVIIFIFASEQTFYFNNFKYFGLDELGNNINSPPIICLHGWPTTQLPIEDLIVIIGCYIAIDWITDIVIFINILSSLINIANSAAVDGKLRHHSRLSLLPLIIITVGCVCRRRLFSSSS